MKVILLKDVKGQGKKGDVLEVSPGYARNFLLPGGHATEASASNLNSIKLHKEAEEHRKAVEKKQALELVARLKNVTVKLPLKVSKNGKIFGALTSQMVADEFFKQGIELDKRKIILPEHIKLIGKYKIQIKPYPDVSAEVEIEVVPQK